MANSSTKSFIILALTWELIVGIIFGVFFRYSDPATFTSMGSSGFFYNWSIDPNTSQLVSANTTQAPFPFVVVLLFIALLIVGTFCNMQVWPSSPPILKDSQLWEWPLPS